MEEIVDIFDRYKNILPLNCQFFEGLNSSELEGKKINKLLQSNKTGFYNQTQRPFKSVTRLF